MDEKSVAHAVQEANELFAALGKAAEESAREGVHQLDVLEITKKAGLRGVDEGVLRELQIPLVIPCHYWLPWHCWFPWRPLWCWWWRRHYPWYGWCCPYWWHRCHWHYR